MADYVVSRHNAVMERLRRRIELFRQHHNNESRYDSTAVQRHEIERQHSLALHQRCLQTKAKSMNKQRRARTRRGREGAEAARRERDARGAEQKQHTDREEKRSEEEDSTGEAEEAAESDHKDDSTSHEKSEDDCGEPNEQETLEEQVRSVCVIMNEHHL